MVGRTCAKRADPCTDAFVAGLISSGALIKCELQVLVTDQWLLSVVPNIANRCAHDPRMCRVLSLAYLWAAWDEEASHHLPPVERDRIRTSFVNDHGAFEGDNPVRKIKLHVIKNNNRLDFVERANQGQVGDAAAAAANGVGDAAAAAANGGNAAGVQADAQQEIMAEHNAGRVTNEQLLAAVQ